MLLPEIALELRAQASLIKNKKKLKPKYIFDLMSQVLLEVLM